MKPKMPVVVVNEDLTLKKNGGYVNVFIVLLDCCETAP